MQMLMQALAGNPQSALQSPGPQAPSMLPAPAPQQSPMGPDQVGSGGNSLAPVDTTQSEMSAPGQAGAPTSPFGLLPQRQGDMWNPPFTGAEPTSDPSGSSPPNSGIQRDSFGALLLPPTISHLMQMISNGRSS